MSINAVRNAALAAGVKRSWLVPVACLLTVGALRLSTNRVKNAANRGLNPLTLLTWSVVGAALVVGTVNALTARPPRPDRRCTEYFVVAALIDAVAPNLLMLRHPLVAQAGRSSNELQFGICGRKRTATAVDEDLTGWKPSPLDQESRDV